MKKLCIFLTILLSACQTKTSKSTFNANNTSSLEIIGAVESVYIQPFKTPFLSRVDTGAQTSSIDAKNIKSFERDSNPWVSFTIENKASKEKHHYKLPIKRITNITRTGVDEKRYVIDLNVTFAGKVFNTEFSLNNRDKFEFQSLIGRNILTGNFIVDVSTSNTFY